VKDEMKCNLTAMAEKEFRR